MRASNRVRSGAYSLLVALAGSLLVVVSAQVAGAGTPTFEIVIPIDTLVRAPAGSETVLEQMETPAALIGETCAVSARSENQRSAHPDNDLVIESEQSVVLEDVEAEPGVVVDAEGFLVDLGEAEIQLIAV